ncbi:TlpA disulfide reductase family protein [Aquimarina sp. AU58]|uniref:TlpA family protein disulfide reductase n=1 Tax=Aquimarina sp. AU58 TaxID=1874112 RepID=UPI000D6DD8B7|nr:TlpA disulfide reductase family protein [Aquimarina sp. AU58]
MRKIVLSSVIIVSLIIVSCSDKKNTALQAIQEENKMPKAIEFTLEGIYNKSDHKIPNLKSLEGKIVILDFWAIWCGPCVAAFPRYNKLSAKYKDKGVQFIGITDDPKEKLSNFFEKVEIDFWVGRDDDKQDFKNYEIIFRPTMIIINRDGKIAYRGSSVTEAMIEEVLATNTIATPEKDECLREFKYGGFYPGADPMYTGVFDFMNTKENDIKVPKSITQYIIRPSLNKKSIGYAYGVNKSGYVGITYDGHKLINLFQYMNNLSSPIWVKNKTTDTISYDIIYYKKSEKNLTREENLKEAYKKIEKDLLDGLSMELKTVKSIQEVNKLIIEKKNDDIIKPEDIEDGAQKAYTPMRYIVTQLENKTGEYFIIDTSLQDMLVYNKGMNYKTLKTAEVSDILDFLSKKGINTIKKKESIETFEITNK